MDIDDYHFKFKIVILGIPSQIFPIFIFKKGIKVQEKHHF